MNEVRYSDTVRHGAARRDGVSYTYERCERTLVSFVGYRTIFYEPFTEKRH